MFLAVVPHVCLLFVVSSCLSNYCCLFVCCLISILVSGCLLFVVYSCLSLFVFCVLFVVYSCLLLFVVVCGLLFIVVYCRLKQTTNNK